MVLTNFKEVLHPFQFTFIAFFVYYNFAATLQFRLPLRKGLKRMVGASPQSAYQE